MSATRLRELAEAAQGAWGTEWYADIMYDPDPGMYGVTDENVGGVMLSGGCEEVAQYVAAVNPAVLLGLLNELDQVYEVLRVAARWFMEQHPAGSVS